MEKTSYGVGLIGTGYMGKCHALAFGSVKAVFGNLPDVRLEFLCDVESEIVKKRADEFGFSKWTTDWKDLLLDDTVDIVAITTPNAFHKEIAMAALSAGKAVYCEKPMAISLSDGEEMAQLARRTQLPTLVGYNYIRNPALVHAKKLVDQGAIGRVIQFRGTCDEDYMADETVPYTWRCRIKDAGTGTLGDLAVHLVSVAQFLLGDIDELCGEIDTVHKERPFQDKPHEYGTVENEDQANAIFKFKSGVQGVLCSSRSCWGRKNSLTWEIHGSEGTLEFNQERMNELRLYQREEKPHLEGFKTILTSPDHEPYGQFVPSPGHQLGFNDLKVIEVAGLLQCLSQGTEPYPSFQDALHFERVIHSIVKSSKERRWISIK